MSQIVMTLISLFILVVVLVPRCTATNFTNYGTNFYFGLMKNAGYTNGLLALVLSTASGINVSVTINIPGSPLNELISSPNHAPITSLSGKRVVSESSTYDNRNRGIHVSSDQPIAVSAFNWLSGSLGEYLVLPCHDYNINKYEYYAVSARSTSNITSSQVLLVGCENDTNIIITPSEAVFLPSDTQSSTDQLVSVPKGTPHHVLLHQGQTLYFGAPLIDLTGTHIVSNKPLTVISGHECGQVPLGAGYCEHMTQQIPPTITWGKQFLLVPFEHRQSGQYTKLVTSQDHTRITISCNGLTTDVVIINSKGGNYTFFFSSSQYCHIQANKPIIVVLFATGGSIDSNFGDPIMILVPPIEQYSSRYDFPVINMNSVGISVTTTPEDFSPNSILLDGLPLTNWVTILNSSMDIVGYGTKTGITANPRRTVVHTGNGTLSVLLYGFDSNPEVGYGFPVGMMLMPFHMESNCTPPCINGACVSDNFCDCIEGWTGDICNQAVCIPQCGHGTCIQPDECACDPGWTGLRCTIDINECSNVTICDHHCNNTVGSFYCYCDIGYMLLSDNRTCQDINECNGTNHRCSQICTNTIGSYYCSCKPGYNYTGNGQCQDIDECLTGRSGCQHNCVNLNGSYYCLCKSGYRLRQDNMTCDDINECKENKSLCSNELGKCVNTLGSYMCVCVTGYSMNANGTCEDIDECSMNNGGCSQVCNNTNGNYSCSCYSGYELKDSYNCFDIDECSNSTLNKCQHICKNNIGSYYCECNQGYTLQSDNRTCEILTCHTLLTPTNGSLTCSNGSKINSNCSYSCDVGYQLTGSHQRSCQPNRFWSGVPTLCRPLQCRQLDPPDKGYIQLPCSRDYLSKCSVRCFDGYDITNGSDTVKCRLIDATKVEWTSFGKCEKKPSCYTDRCKHGGKCTETEDGGFICNCTGTFYRGKTCDRLLVIIDDIGVVDSGYFQSTVISIKSDPNVVVKGSTINHDHCQSGGVSLGNFGLLPCPFNLNNEVNLVRFNITPGLYSFQPYFDKDVIVQPPGPIPFIVSSQQSSVYFLTFQDKDYIQQSCCSLDKSFLFFQSVLVCPRSENGLQVQLISSCSWYQDNNYGLFISSGIIFSSYNNLQLPVSLAGIVLTPTPVKLTLPTDRSSCGNCNEQLKSLNNIDVNRDDVCYEHSATTDDLEEFVKNQSLTDTFLKMIQQLLPKWILLTTSPDNTAINKIGNEDFMVNIVELSSLYSLTGCESLIVDRSEGYFSVLQHNGPLNLTLESLESTILRSPQRGSFYCIAVHLCSGIESSVYIGIPSSVQQDITSISYISKYINKGWTLEISSVVLRNNVDNVPMFSKYWNGMSFDFHLSRQLSQFDMILKVKSTGSFSYANTSVTVVFDGMVWYQYVYNDTINTQPNIALLFGDFEVLLLSVLNQMEEEIKFLKQSTNASLYHEFPPSNCSTPSSGLSIKLSYVPRSNQSFYNNLLQLPYNKNTCPVDVFINLDSNKDMKGLSFYSNCLELKFGSLLFWELEHKFYIPMTDDTLCIKPENFTSLFPNSSQFGLVVHSSLLKDNLPLGRFFTLQQGYSDNITVSLGFFHSTSNRVGLLNSVKIIILDGSFIAPIILRNNELTFSGSTTIFGNYFTHVTGLASTNYAWEDLTIDINGWFQGNLTDVLEMYVHNKIERISQESNSRKTTADEQYVKTQKTYLAAKLQVQLAEDLLNNATALYNTSLDMLRAANNSLIQAEERVANATGIVKQAQNALDNVCTIKVCDMICQKTIRTRTVYRRVFVNITQSCNANCSVTLRTRVPPFYESAIVWRFIWECWINRVKCGSKLCESLRCSSICKSVNVTRPVYNYTEMIILRPCIVPCIKQKYNTTVTETDTFIDPCGQRIQNTTCVKENENCSREVEAAIRLIENRRQGVVEPLRERNEAKRTFDSTRINVSRAYDAVQIANRNLQTAREILTSAKGFRNASEKTYHMIIDSIEYDLVLYNLTQQYSLSEIYTIVNITFSVDVKTVSPVIFPINIIANIYSQTQSTFAAPFHFKQSLLTQKDAIVDEIINTINPRSNRRRKRAVEPKEGQDEEQFEKHCSQITGIDSFLQFLQDSLLEANYNNNQLLDDSRTLLGNLRELTLPSGNATFISDYSSLQLLFNITKEEVDQNKKDKLPNSVLDTLLGVIVDMQKSAQDVTSNINASSFLQWQNRMEVLIQTSGSVVDEECFGFADCLVVLNGLIENVLSFAPSNISAVLRTRLPLAAEKLLMLATNNEQSFEEALDNLQSMSSIINDMKEIGYWCAKPPQIIKHPVETTSVPVNGRLVLMCQGNSKLPITYQWRKDGIALPDATNETLVIDNFQIFSEGNYSCDITNDVKSVQSTNSSVNAYELPQFYLTPNSVVTYIGDGNGAYFTCNATSRPDPGWKWYHKTSLQDKWEEIIGEETNELLIRRPDVNHIGWYVCMAYNDYGNITSDPVYLRLISVTAHVLSYPVEFFLNRGNETGQSSQNRSTEPIEKVVYRKLKNEIDFCEVTLDQLTVTGSNTLFISVHLIGRNVTVNETGKVPLTDVVENLLTAKEQLDSVQDNMRNHFTSTTFELEYEGNRYMSSPNSFSSQLPEILCPPGQELHPNTFLCIDCLEGHHQVTEIVTTFIDGESVTERVPRCALCPLNTYQDKVGGERCIQCPFNHFTFSTGAKSEDECIGLCPPNSYSLNGLSPCDRCPKKTYQPQYGETSCIPCTKEEDDPACVDNPCELPKKTGNCTNYQLRFYYHSCNEQCEPFLYGGCNGNKNNFMSLDDCSEQCGCPGNKTKVQCVTDPCLSRSCSVFLDAQCIPDYCGECTARFYYQGEEVTDICDCPPGLVVVSCCPSCLPTCYEPNPVCTPNTDCVPGCGCPDGKVFDNKQQQCVFPSDCSTCSLSSNIGPCKGRYPRWFYNSTSGKCQLFSYGGCFGNRNQFDSLKECTSTCGNCSNSSLINCHGDPCKTGSCPGYPNAVCEYNTCTCTARYYDQFNEVTNECDTCGLPPVIGPCTRNISRWYFNQMLGKCQSFLYGGCDGNNNNFQSLEKCVQTCDTSCDPGQVVTCLNNPCDNKHCPNIPNAVCVSKSCGVCSAHFYNTTGDDVTDMCINCPSNKTAVLCSTNLCDHQTCPNFPQAKCKLDICGECQARFYINDTEVTDECMSCEGRGQIFKPCGGSCNYTCDDILSRHPLVCLPYCKPGCECPTGQILDEKNKRCVFEDQCPCPSCDSVPSNCTHVITPSNDRCSCPFCADCDIDGQVYEDPRHSCPKTCSNPYVHCVHNNLPGCSCPQGQVIDELNKRCVPLKDCPKPDPCKLPPEQGPCSGNFKRYYFNSTSGICLPFIYGGCLANENNFFSKYLCEQQCSDCYPVCSNEFCTIHRQATCSISSSLPGSSPNCPGGCAISNCRACYYSYNDLASPSSCSQQCSMTNEKADERCMAKWGLCMYRAHLKLYKSVLSHERNDKTFRCWAHQCT